MAFEGKLPPDFVEQLLREKVRSNIKTMLMPQAMAELDAVVDAAVASLDVEIKMARDNYNMKDMFDIQVTRSNRQ